MELSEIQAFIPTFDELQKKVRATKGGADNVPTYLKQYDPKEHDVKKTDKRLDKIINTENGTETVFVARLPIPFQRQIVNRAASFLCGNPIQLMATPEENSIEEQLLTVLTKTWDDNKLDYESKSIAKIMMSETEVAELWYTEDAGQDYWKGTPNDTSSVKFRLRMKVLAASKGDGLYPVFNSFGDMVAFGRSYKVIEDGKTIECFDLYTETQIVKGKKIGNDWTTTPEANTIGKIPVIYYSQEYPEWHEVQEMIDRLEKLISNHADTNDYHSSPTIKVKGTVKGFSKKGEQGKIIEMEGDSDASYMNWTQAVDSTKLEYQNLRSLIFDMTDTPDISFEQAKGLGNYSGVALKMLFLGAHLKASDKEELFGKGIQRRINYLKAALAKINVKLEPALTLSIKPKFEYYLPKNDSEKIDMLSTATNSKLISRKSAILMTGMVDNVEDELTQIDAEQNSASVLNEQFN